MRPEDIRTFLTKKPFQLFRITLTDWRSYEIRHPELVAVGRSIIFIGLPSADDPEPVFDRFVWVSLLHVVQVEPVELAAG